MQISTQKLENIKLQITFPFANKNDENEITIYQKTIEEVMKLFAEERFYGYSIPFGALEGLKTIFNINL